MTDFIDVANEHAEMLLRHALYQQRERAAAIEAARPARSAFECEGARCGEPIPEPRRLAVPGVTLCIDCQRRLERGPST